MRRLEPGKRKACHYSLFTVVAWERVKVYITRSSFSYLHDCWLHTNCRTPAETSALEAPTRPEPCFHLSLFTRLLSTMSREKRADSVCIFGPITSSRLIPFAAVYHSLQHFQQKQRSFNRLQTPFRSTSSRRRTSDGPLGIR